jgi:hypothetical protein
MIKDWALVQQALEQRRPLQAIGMFHRAKLVFREGGLQEPAPLLPVTESSWLQSIQPTNIEWKHVTQLSTNIAHFCLHLDPPVVVARDRALDMMRLVQAKYTEQSPITTAIDEEEDGSIFLFEALVRETVPAQAIPQGDWPMFFSHRCTWHTDSMGSATIHPQTYTLTSDPTTIQAVHVSCIPFSHPSQVQPLLDILRQQLLFNSLFQSCFHAAAYRQTDLLALDIVEESVVHAEPDALNVQATVVDAHLSFHAAISERTVAIDFYAQPGGRLELSVTVDGEVDAALSAKADDALKRLGGNIPLLFEYCRKVLGIK